MSGLRVGINALIAGAGAGGTEQNLLRLLRSLVRRAGEARLTVAAPPEAQAALREAVGEPHELIAGRPVHRGPAPRVTGVRTLWQRVKWILRRTGAAERFNARAFVDAGAQVVHFPYQEHYPVHVPFVFEPWDLQHLHLPDFFGREEIERRERVYRTGCDRAALIVTAGEWTKQDLVSRYGIAPRRIAVIRRGAFGDDTPMPIDEADRILARHKLPTGYLLYPAKDFAHKNHVRLFEAIAKVRAGGIDARLVCCGRVLPENRTRWDARLRELGIAEQVTLLGRVDDDTVRALFARARALVFPSLFEGLGIPILEAFAAGVPVVTTRAACIPETAGEAAVYADGTDVESLAAGIARLFVEPDLAGRLVEAGRRRLGLFDWDAAADEFLACYRCVAGVGGSEDHARLASLTGSSSASAASASP